MNIKCIRTLSGTFIVKEYLNIYLVSPVDDRILDLEHSWTFLVLVVIGILGVVLGSIESKVGEVVGSLPLVEKDVTLHCSTATTNSDMAALDRVSNLTRQ